MLSTMSRNTAQPVRQPTPVLISLPLAADDISALPAPIRKRITEGETEAPTDWALLVTGESELTGLVQDVISRLASMVAAGRRQLTEDNVELLIRSMLPHAPRSKVGAQLELDNARLRAAYLSEVPTRSGREVRAASGLHPKNASEPASRWKRERRVFAVRHGGRDLFPAFQFEDGCPRPVIKQILREIPPSTTAWQIAIWFASGNGWLDGAEPRNRLDAPDEVIEAARRLADATEG